MSGDSSKAPVHPAAALPGWQIASLVLVSVILLFFTSQLVGGVVIGLYAGLQHWDAAQIQSWLANSVGAQFAYGVLAEALLVVGVGAVLRWLHWRWADIGMVRPKLGHLLIGVVSVVPYFVFYLVLLTVLAAIFPGLNVAQQQQIGFSSVQGTFDLALAFIGLVVVPPIAEEITMRGFLYTGLKKWLPAVLAGLVVSVLFGAAHLAEGGDSGPLWVGAIDTFTLSLVLVFLREKTGSLWAGIALHATKNFIAFATLFLIRG
jgi:membrane protease YdiL (CAAX protease family)